MSGTSIRRVWKDVARLSVGVVLLCVLCLASLLADVLALPITGDCQCEARNLFKVEQGQYCLIWMVLWPLLNLVWAPFVGWVGGGRLRPVAVLLSVLSEVALSAYYLFTEASGLRVNGVELGSPSRVWLIVVALVLLLVDFALAVFVAHRFVVREVRKTAMAMTGITGSREQAL